MLVTLKKLTIAELLERSISAYSSLPAVGFVGERSQTFQELRQGILSMAGLLLGRGILRGDRVAILGDNCPNWVTAYLAITSLGAVAVPILTGFPETDTRHIIRNSESVAVFVDQKQRPKIEEMDNSPLQFVVSLDDFQIADAAKAATGFLGKTLGIFKKEKEPLPTAVASFKDLPGADPDDLAAIIYTSGTTGNSKGVMLTHGNIVYDVVNSIERFPISDEDRFLSILPLAHTFEATGGMLCPLTVGASIYYMHGLPTPQILLAAMAEVKPTAVLTVPLVMDKIFRKKVLPQIQKKAVIHKLYSVPFLRKKLHHIAGKKVMESFGGRLRFFMFGGASLNEDVEVFMRDAGISYSTGYGMTETAPIMTINPFGKVKVGSCGRSIPGIEMAIHEPDAASGVGEIIVRGPIVMQGYYKNPQATADMFLPDNWLKTGDLGTFDAEGYLFIKGRSKNVIIGPSGENIYPEIIEQKLMQFPTIQECVVYEKEGRLVAKAYLDFDVLDREFERGKLDDAEAQKLTADILERVRQEINLQLPTFSQLSRLTEHPEPFEKTPTNKVKRYLYID